VFQVQVHDAAMTGLQETLDALVTEFGVTGVGAGVLIDGQEEHAFAGVTSVENPLPVDAQTVFQFGSTGKTFTATALMVLREQGLLELDAPVRRYVPELQLADEDVAERVTVLQLLNHTAGWEGDGREDGSEGDDALEVFVSRMGRLKQVTPLGSAVSYNNASLSLAGRVIEKVTGQEFQHALQDLVLTPLGLDMTFFNSDGNQLLTRRVAVGHTHTPEEGTKVHRPWSLPRGGSPAGGMSANVGDQLAWARYHLGDGRPLLSQESLDLMKQPTADMPGSALGDHVGISWLLSDVEGHRLVAHGGSTMGHLSDFLLVPALNFAFTTMTNSAPNGAQLNHALQTWALQHYCGLTQAEPRPLDSTDEVLAEYVGRFVTIAAICDITAVPSRLEVKVTYTPESIEAMGEDPGEQPPIVLGLTGDDRYVVAEGAAKGMTGYFRRDSSGRVDGIHLGGRLATRVAVPA
jgi:CubicO group peptidase (beta-lactamase class C family)